MFMGISINVSLEARYLNYQEGKPIRDEWEKFTETEVYFTPTFNRYYLLFSESKTTQLPAQHVPNVSSW